MLHPLSTATKIISGWLTVNMETSCFPESSVSLITNQSSRYNKQENLNTQKTAERASCLKIRVHMVVYQSYSRL